MIYYPSSSNSQELCYCHMKTSYLKEFSHHPRYLFFLPCLIFIVFRWIQISFKKKNLRRSVVPGSGNRSGALWYLLISLKLRILEFLSSLKRQYFLNENESLLKYFVEAQPVHFQEEKLLWITIPCSLLRAMSTSIRTEAGYSIWCLCLRGKQISKQCM